MLLITELKKAGRLEKLGRLWVAGFSWLGNVASAAGCGAVIMAGLGASGASRVAARMGWMKVEGNG